MPREDEVSPRPLSEPEITDLLELAIDCRLSETDLWSLAEAIAERDLLELEVEDHLKPVAAVLRAVYLLGYSDGANQDFHIHPKGEY